MDGQTSKRHQARLEGFNSDRRTVSFYYGDQFEKLLTVDFNALTIESRLGNTPREINLDNGQIFVTSDNDAVDQFVQYYSGHRKPSLLHKLEQHSGLVAISSLLTIGFVAFLLVYGVPKAAKLIAYQMPDDLVEQMGDGLILLDKFMFDPSELDPDRQLEIRALVETYLQAHSDLNPVLEFRSGVGPNAFALPGGDIVFTDELIKLAATDDEIVAVLFHELGHLENKHLLRRVLQDSMITLLVITITGDLDVADLATGLPTLIVDLTYSRDFEIEADRYALQQLYRFGIPIESFATIMQRLDNYVPPEDEEAKGDASINESPDDKTGQHSSESIDDSKSKESNKIVDFFSTHPATEDRVLMVQRYKQEHGIN